MTKPYARFISGLFCAFLALFAAANALTHDREFSPVENRSLAQRPKLSAAKVLSGEFMSDFEEYVTDQFVGRTNWVSGKARAEKLAGKLENNGVYFGTDGRTLIADYPVPDEKRVAENLNYVSKLGEKLPIPVYFSLIPGKSQVYADLLPAGAPVGDQQEILDRASQTPNVTWLALAGKDYGGWDKSLNYYATDHHWTTRGAYNGYRALMEGMGLEGVAAETFTTVTEDFQGTTWSSSGAYWYPPDRMEIAVSDEGVSVTNNFTGQPMEGSLYNYDKLEQKDKYPFFLGGNQPLCVVKSEKPGATGRLLVVRDSFSDSLAPFLTQNFAEVHLVDLRYYKVPLGQYVAENRIDQVLVLYSVDNFVSDANLFVLGM